MKQALRTTLMAAAVFPISLLVSGCFGGGGGGGDDSPAPVKTVETVSQKAAVTPAADGTLPATAVIPQIKPTLASLTGSTVDLDLAGSILKDADGNVLKDAGDLVANVDIAASSKDFGLSGNNYVGVVTKIGLTLAGKPVADSTPPFTAKVCLPTSSSVKAGESVGVWVVKKSDLTDLVAQGSEVLGADKCVSLKVGTEAAKAVAVTEKLPLTLIIGKREGSTGATGGGN